jgi:sporulation protein YlmC with PRC-barrel domain
MNLWADYNTCIAIHMVAFDYALLFLRYVMGLAHLLVEWGIFKKVKIGFLPVGHTHDDVDQMFSCFSTPLKRAEIFELQDITNVCQSNYVPKPQFFHLEHMASWATHFAKLLPKQVKGITKPRCFVISRDKKGVVRHKYRNQLQTSKKDPQSQDCWMPVNGPGFRMFERGLPDPSTVVRVPTKAADLVALSDTLKKTEDYMSGSQRQWWKDVIGRFRDEDKVACIECTKLREEMKINSVVKKDVGDARKIKSAAYRKAYKAMYKHLGDEDNRSLHALFYGNEDEPLQRIVEERDDIVFGSSIGKLLKVRTPYRWVNGAWSESMEERVLASDLSVEERVLVQKLDTEQREGVANHVVSSINKEKDRDAAREKENPNYEFQIGDWCVLRQDVSEEPFFVGRIHEMDMDDESGIVNKLFVHESGSEESKQMEKNKCLTTSRYRLRWQRVQEVDVEIDGKTIRKTVTIDQYTKGNSAAEKGFKRVLSTCDPAAVVEWGQKDKMLTKSDTLMATVQRAISTNPRVDWNASNHRAPAVSSLFIAPASSSSSASFSSSSSSASSSSSSSASSSSASASQRGEIDFVD